MTEFAKPQNIDWGKFQTDYVQLKTGVEKRLKMENWRQGSWFNMMGLRFDVIEEDGKAVSKIFSTTSKRLIRSLKPIMQKAEAKGRNVIAVSILREGEGLSTTYEVKENDSSAKMD